MPEMPFSRFRIPDLRPTISGHSEASGRFTFSFNNASLIGRVDLAIDCAGGVDSGVSAMSTSTSGYPSSQIAAFARIACREVSIA